MIPSLGAILQNIVPQSIQLKLSCSALKGTMSSDSTMENYAKQNEIGLYRETIYEGLRSIRKANPGESFVN